MICYNMLQYAPDPLTYDTVRDGMTLFWINDPLPKPPTLQSSGMGPAECA